MNELDQATLKEAINGDLPLVVDFWAPWCMPCKLYAPVIEELSDELDGRMNFAKLDIQDYPDVAKEYDIASIPTLIVFKKGEPVERLVGLMPKEDVLKALQAQL